MIDFVMSCWDEEVQFFFSLSFGFMLKSMFMWMPRQARLERTQSMMRICSLR